MGHARDPGDVGCARSIPGDPAVLRAADVALDETAEAGRFRRELERTAPEPGAGS